MERAQQKKNWKMENECKSWRGIYDDSCRYSPFAKDMLVNLVGSS